MAQHVMKLPDVGEGVVEAEVVEWAVKPGDQVSEDQHIVDVMTDKATVEITAPVSGVVLETFGEAGDMLAVGSPLIVFETDAQVTQTIVESEVPTEREESVPLRTGRSIAAPAVRRRAREAHVDLSLVSGTGKGGRVTHADLDAYIAAGSARQEAGSPALEPEMAPPRESSSPPGEGTRQVEVIGLRRAIGEKMALSKRSIPHYTYVEEVDVTRLEELREHLNENRKDGQTKLTYLPFLVKALVRALEEFPQCNARFDQEAGIVTEHHEVHVGIATHTDGGLMVPVLRDAASQDLWQIAAEIERLSEAARTGKASRADLTGSTITITSLGKLGGIVTTPVINHPEVAIIGVNKSIERPVVQNGEVVVRLMMNLSASFDHRIVDGYVGAQLVQRLKGLLEVPGAIFV